jgi:hypothetical protein
VVDQTRTAAAILMVLLICLHVPHLYDRINHEIISPPQDRIFALQTYDDLFREIGDRPARFDTADFTAAFVFRSEVARRSPKAISWTEQAWHHASLDYFTNHAAPPGPEPIFSIDQPSNSRSAGAIIMQTRNLVLYNLADSKTGDGH